jgi:hypothetical protein
MQRTKHPTVAETRPILLLVPLLCFLASPALAQTFNFNAGNDTGFTRYSPLAPFGAAGTFSFPDGGYRIQAPGSPDPASFGPGRAGSFANANSYTTFTTSVDLVDWDNNLDQAFGILARTTTVGLGTTNGYAFTYATDGPSIDISKVTGEQASNLGSADVTLDPSRDYRLVFQGSGNSLVGTVYDLADLTTPLATATATDDAYTSGVNGVFVFDNSATKDQPADATFDNLSASNQVPEPTALSLLLLAPLLRRRRR